MSQTGFRVSVVCDSVWQGVRLTTFACRFPRTVLAEMNTHRALSRNAASSRAIPVSHFIEEVENRPYLPGDLPDGELCGNESGMVATKPLDSLTKRGIRQRYSWAAKEAAASAKHMAELGAHKQDVNRLLEPFQWVRWVGTATDWDNFFALRTDHRAYPPFRFLARCMWVAFRRSVPQDTRFHLPFITDEDWCEAESEDSMEAVYPPDWFLGCGVASALDDIVAAYNLMAWSAARCARVSVKNFRTDDTDRKKDHETFLKLTTDTPRHASPLEHQAFAFGTVAGPGSSNFRRPWHQFRKLLPAETVERFDPPAEEVARWNIPDDVFGGTPGVDW